MNNQIPAAQGTTLRQYDEDGDHRDYPIVGWWNLSGQFAQPLLPVPNVMVHGGSVIIVPHTEAVEFLYCHPASGMVFDDEDLAAEHVGDYLTEHPLPKQAEPAATTAPATPKLNISNPGNGPVHFGAKKYATNSYWHWAGQNAVFMIKGDTVYPSDDRVKKIKREEFAELKRSGAAEIDPHAGEVMETGNEPAAPDDGESVEDLV